MTYTEQQITEALGDSIFYIHTDERRHNVKPESKRPVDRIVIGTKKGGIRMVKQKGAIPKRYLPLADACANVYGIPPDMISSDSRRHHVVAAKRLFVWFLRAYLCKTYPQIGDVLGIDHTTALHHYNVFEARKYQNAELIAGVLSMWRPS